MFKKIISSFLISAICILSIVKSEPLVYNDIEFTNNLKNHQIAMVMFYAPWCGYSKALLPEFDLASNTLESYLSEVKLIKVNCYDEQTTQTCSNQKIGGYPTVKVFKNGAFYKNYNGERKTDDIVSFAFDVFYGVQ